MMNVLSKLVLTLFALAPTLSLYGQEANRCATVEYTQDKKNLFPGLQATEQEMSRQVHNMVQSAQHKKYAQHSVSTVITIPVVFHVVYNTTTHNNSVSATRIQSQLDVLNKDFSKTNTDIVNIPSVWQPLAANTQIQFCMATRKPNGDWTNGIERRQTAMTAYTTGGVDSVKFTSLGGLDAWDPTQYLNIWVINFANGVLGVTQMPLTGPLSTDGICIQYTAFGTGSGLLANYNKGRTATHEVGHWLGLFHIWGDDNGTCVGSDSISDTPNQATAHFNCPSFPAVDSCSPVSPGTMFVNYMDYSYDRCMYMFTLEQSSRMNIVLSTVRTSILTSVGCNPAIGIEEKELERFIACYPNPSDEWITVELDFPVAQNMDVSFYDAMGRLLLHEELRQATTRQVRLPVSEFPNGIYYLRFTIDGNTLSKRMIVSHPGNN